MDITKVYCDVVMVRYWLPHPQQEVLHWALLSEHSCVNFSGMKSTLLY